MKVDYGLAVAISLALCGLVSYVLLMVTQNPVFLGYGLAFNVIQVLFNFHKKQA